MNEPQAATSVWHSVVVDVPIDQAFNVFTEDFGRFKPPEHNLLGVEIAETVFEARVGGLLYDLGIDGSECRWARVLVHEGRAGAPPLGPPRSGMGGRPARC